MPCRHTGIKRLKSCVLKTIKRELKETQEHRQQAPAGKARLGPHQLARPLAHLQVEQDLVAVVLVVHQVGLVAHQVVLVRNLLQLLVLALHQALVGQPQPLVLPQVP